jgi:O-antigen/teichoic acid export membrane protein
VAWAALPALGDRRSALAATTTAAAINLGLAALLIRSHGTAGAVIANAAGQLIATVWVFVALARRHGYRFPAADLAKIAIAAALAFGAARQAGPELGQLVLGATAGSIVFGVACVLGRVVARGEWSAIVARLRPGAPPAADVPEEPSHAVATRPDAGLSRE